MKKKLDLTAGWAKQAELAIAGGTCRLADR
jgi:hypothetical protein